MGQPIMAVLFLSFGWGGLADTRGAPKSQKGVTIHCLCFWPVVEVCGGKGDDMCGKERYPSLSVRSFTFLADTLWVEASRSVNSLFCL